MPHAAPKKPRRPTLAAGQHLPHVAVLIETSRGYGRGLLEGVAQFHRQHGPWSIFFEPHGLNDPPPKWLRTNDEGNFTLQYSRTEPGVLRGTHTVFLKYYVSADEELHKIQPKASRELKGVLAGKYGDIKTSGLAFEIMQDGQFIEIELK